MPGRGDADKECSSHRQQPDTHSMKRYTHTQEVSHVVYTHSACVLLVVLMVAYFSHCVHFSPPLSTRQVTLLSLVTQNVAADTKSSSTM